MSAKGNGADMGQALTILRELAAGQQEIRGILDEHGRKLDEHGRKLDEHGRKLDELTAGLSGLRQTVTEYHATVLGHGVLFSQIEERVRRIERHLNLPPAAA